MTAELNTDHLSDVNERAVDHLTDPNQLHLSERHWGTERRDQ
jgi:hypothetical protein